MFTNQLISKEIQSQLPEGYIIRPLEVGDYEKGILFAILTIVYVFKLYLIRFIGLLSSID
jgi:glucosamine-phosphate N-acetyltransferase